MAGNPVVQCVGPSYQLNDRKAAVQRTVNMYVLGIEGAGEARRAILESAPGLRGITSLGRTIRGSYAANDRWFIVADSILFEVTDDLGTTIQRGVLDTDRGFVAMTDGQTQLVLVDGPFGYVFDLDTNVFTKITSDGWRGSNWVEELDGYFIFVAPGTDQFYISATDNALSLDPLDFSSADSIPDPLVTHRVLKRELFLFGETSTEVWIDSGNADFPFVRYDSQPIGVGIVGSRAAIVSADTLVWVGRTRRGAGYVYEMNGHQPVRISTQAVEEAIQKCTDLSQISMWTYQISGNEFVAVNGPGMETTWVYDFSTGQWHERAELVDGEYQPFRAEFVTFVHNKHYVTSNQALYVFDSTKNDLEGAPLARERTWPHLVSPSLDPISYRGLDVMCRTAGAGVITLEISNDGGSVYGPPLQRSLGVTGRRMQKVRWLMLGSAIDRVFRLRVTDNVPFAIYQATVDA